MKILRDIEKLINSELATKIQNSFIKNSELTIEINENDEKLAIEKVEEMCKKLLVNLIIEDYQIKKLK